MFILTTLVSALPQETQFPELSTTDVIVSNVIYYSVANDNNSPVIPSTPPESPQPTVYPRPQSSPVDIEGVLIFIAALAGAAIFITLCVAILRVRRHAKERERQREASRPWYRPRMSGGRRSGSFASSVNNRMGEGISNLFKRYR